MFGFDIRIKKNFLLIFAYLLWKNYFWERITFIKAIMTRSILGESVPWDHLKMKAIFRVYTHNGFH